jgi:NADH dehydrogenase
MRVLVTGGTGVIGEGVLPALLSRGHTVRLLTRHADEDVREWPEGVEPFRADITTPAHLKGAADKCDAIIHITGIVAETPPSLTFDRVNVGGTKNVLTEATRAGVPRFVFVSSLGADRGTSAYHQSKREAEQLVGEYSGSWAIVRPGGVYGPGDEVMSMLLKMHRTLPVIPVIGLGDQEFQPIFYADLGEALATAAERDDLTGIFEIAGEDVTTPAEVLRHLAALTGRQPIPIPVPEFIANIAVQMADAAGISMPVDDAKLKMLVEHNVVEPPSKNALRNVFDVEPTPLADGLAFLVDAQPEQQPGDGMGPLQRKRFWANIHGAPVDSRELMDLIREQCTELMTVEFAAEPGTPQEIVEGSTLTAALPFRGNIQVRVAKVTPTSFTLVTLRGHPLAGIVRFDTRNVNKTTVRFTITIAARAATMVDWLAMTTVGRVMQDQNWTTVVERVVELSGGSSDGVQTATEVFDDEDASRVQGEIAELVAKSKRTSR